MKDNGKNEKTAKGVRKYVIKKNITHENYKDCLLNRKQIIPSLRTIRSECHQIGSYQLNKILLGCFNIMTNGIYSRMELRVMRMGIKIYKNKSPYSI